MNNDIECIEIYDPSLIPMNIEMSEYFAIDFDREEIYDIFYESPSELKSKINEGKRFICIKLIKKQGQKS